MTAKEANREAMNMKNINSGPGNENCRKGRIISNGNREHDLTKIVNISGLFTFFSIRNLSTTYAKLQMKAARIMKYNQLIYIISNKRLKIKKTDPKIF